MRVVFISVTIVVVAMVGAIIIAAAMVDIVGGLIP